MQRNDSRRSNGIARTPSRRSVLSLSAAGIVSTLGGCSSITGQSTSTPGQSDESVFKDISFADNRLVIELAEDHDITRVNLIGPEGSKYGSTNFATGETKGSIQILRISSGDYFHYPTGESTMVAIGEDSSEEKDLSLEPDLTINSASQFDGETPRSNGNLSFVVQNSGNAPTWVYQLYYQDVPNQEAEDDTANKGIPTLALKKPSTNNGAIVGPGESQVVVGDTPPIVFSEKPQCGQVEIEGSVIIDSPGIPAVKSRFGGELSGEIHTVGTSGFTSRYTCGNASVELISDGGEESDA